CRRAPHRVCVPPRVSGARSSFSEASRVGARATRPISISRSRKSCWRSFAKTLGALGSDTRVVRHEEDYVIARAGSDLGTVGLDRLSAAYGVGVATWPG